MKGAFPIIHTSNMAEVLYLLDKGNRIADLGLEPTLEGPTEFMVCLQGESVEADHSAYLRNPTCSLFRLSCAFTEIEAAVRTRYQSRTAGGES